MGTIFFQKLQMALVERRISIHNGQVYTPYQPLNLDANFADTSFCDKLSIVHL